MSVRPDPIYRDAPRATTFAEGIEFQDFVCEQFAKDHIILQNMCSQKYQLRVGENLQGFEIKLDRRCVETGRLSIEIAEKSRDDDALDWTKSGIWRDDNTWLYVQGNYQVLFIFGVNWLRRWHIEKKPTTEESGGTVRKFYLPFRVAQIGAVKVVDFAGVLPEVQSNLPFVPSPGGLPPRRATG